MKFTNKPNVYCNVYNLTETKVMLSKQEHKRKPKYVDHSCRELSIVTRRADSVQFGKSIIIEFMIARVRSNRVRNWTQRLMQAEVVSSAWSKVTDSIQKNDARVRYSVRNLAKSKKRLP